MDTLQKAIAQLSDTHFPMCVRKCIDVLRAFPTFLSTQEIGNLVNKHIFFMAKDNDGCWSKQTDCIQDLQTIHIIAETLNDERATAMGHFILTSLFILSNINQRTKLCNEYFFDDSKNADSGEFWLKHLLDQDKPGNWPQHCLAMLTSFTMSANYLRVLWIIGDWLSQQMQSAKTQEFCFLIDLITDQLIIDHLLLFENKLEREDDISSRCYSPSFQSLAVNSPALANLIAPVLQRWRLFAQIKDIWSMNSHQPSISDINAVALKVIMELSLSPSPENGCELAKRLEELNFADCKDNDIINKAIDALIKSKAVLSPSLLQRIIPIKFQQDNRLQFQRLLQYNHR